MTIQSTLCRYLYSLFNLKRHFYRERFPKWFSSRRIAMYNQGTSIKSLLYSLLNTLRKHSHEGISLFLFDHFVENEIDIFHWLLCSRSMVQYIPFRGLRIVQLRKRTIRFVLRGIVCTFVERTFCNPWELEHFGYLVLWKEL